MKTQNIISHEKLWWIILILNILYSCEIITWKTSWICVYIFDRFKKQIWYDTRTSIIEEA